MSDGVSAPQFTATKGARARGDRSWTCRATISFPVPVSPVTSTVASAGATCSMRLRSARETGIFEDERARANSRRVRTG